MAVIKRDQLISYRFLYISTKFIICIYNVYILITKECVGGLKLIYSHTMILYGLNKIMMKDDVMIQIIEQIYLS